MSAPPPAGAWPPPTGAWPPPAGAWPPAASAGPPAPPPGPGRPGTAVAACVLACVLAVLAVPGAVATWWFTGIADLYGEAPDVSRAGLVVTVVTLAAAVPLVVGAVLTVTGVDRWTLLVAVAVELALSVWWVVQCLAGPFRGEDAPYVLTATALYTALALTAGALTLAPATGQWVAAVRATRRAGPRS